MDVLQYFQLILFGLGQVANLLVVGLFEDDSGNDPLQEPGVLLITTSIGLS